MKRLILVGLFFSVACSHNPQTIAANNIGRYIKEKLNNPDSFELVSVDNVRKDWHQTSLDSDIVAWSYAHQKSKFDPKSIDMCVDSLNKVRPDLAKENIKKLKLIESGKLDYYWTICTVKIIDKGQTKLLKYLVELDTSYNITDAKDITNEKHIIE
ncbi:MAG: hypothetical protein ABI203_01720 [Mucilaginibacter sp.]